MAGSLSGESRMTRDRASGMRAVIRARPGRPQPHDCGGSLSRPEKAVHPRNVREGFHERLSASIGTRRVSHWPSSEGGGHPQPDGQSLAATRPISGELYCTQVGMAGRDSDIRTNRARSDSIVNWNRLGCLWRRRPKRPGQQTAPTWGTEGLCATRGTDPALTRMAQLWPASGH
jgi:hypothetical protein